MSSSLKRLFGVVAISVAVLAGSGGQAHAWYKLRNDTPNKLFVVHAYNSMTGFLCGFNDGCDDRVINGYRVHGWFHIEPGATVTVLSQNWGNAYHQVFANNLFGHVWTGNGDHFGTPNTAFNRCEPLFSDLDIPNPKFVFTSTHRCCGGSCPSNKTDFFFL